MKILLSNLRADLTVVVLMMEWGQLELIRYGDWNFVVQDEGMNFIQSAIQMGGGSMLHALPPLNWEKRRERGTFDAQSKGYTTYPDRQ